MLICNYLVTFLLFLHMFSYFRADKIPVAQYSSYVESCQKERQKDCGYSLLHSCVAHIWLSSCEHITCKTVHFNLKEMFYLTHFLKRCAICWTRLMISSMLCFQVAKGVWAWAMIPWRSWRCSCGSSLSGLLMAMREVGRVINTLILKMQHTMGLWIRQIPCYILTASQSFVYVPVTLSLEMSAQLSRISRTLRVIFPVRPDELIGQPVIKLHIKNPSTSELHIKVFTHDYTFLNNMSECMSVILYVMSWHSQAVNMILRSFCQCLLMASQANPPNKWVVLPQDIWSKALIFPNTFWNMQPSCSVFRVQICEYTDWACVTWPFLSVCLQTKHVVLHVCHCAAW